MKKYFFLLLASTLAILSGCKMAEDTKSGWYAVHIKDESGKLSGKIILQVNGESLSRGLHQAVLQYHSIHKTEVNNGHQELFVIITNRRISEDYVVVTTPDDDSFRFRVYTGGLIFDQQGLTGDEENSGDKNSSIQKLVELMNQYEELKISQGDFYFTIKTTGFSNK